MSEQAAAKFRFVSIWAMAFTAMAFLPGEYVSGQIVQGHLTLAISFILVVAAGMQTAEYSRTQRP